MAKALMSALSNRWITVGDVVISRTRVEVPDHEFGTVHGYPGFTVQDGETGLYRGDYWRDASHVCWRTTDGAHFGRVAKSRDAIAAIVVCSR